MAGQDAPEEGSNASCGKPITLSSFYKEILAAASAAIRHLLRILGLRTSSQGLDQGQTAPPPPPSILYPGHHHCNSTIREPADWSLLPSHLLITIAEKLFVADIIRLPVVCKTWAWSLGLPHNGWPNPPRYRASFVPIPPSVPWMLLPNQYGEHADFLYFLKLSDGQVQLISPVPEMVGRRCVGASPDGWLVTLDLELNPRVLNPLTGEELPLPSLFTLFPYPANVRFLHDYPDGSLIGFFTKHAGTSAESYHARACFRDAYFLKIVLTSAPPFGVATVFFGFESRQTQLAFSRVGDASWTPVPLSGELSEGIEDVMYLKEDRRLYAVNSSGCLMFFDLHICDWPSGLWKSPKPLPMKPTVVANIKDGFFGINRRSHLVFLSGRFLRICRSVNAYKNWEAVMLRLGLPLEFEDEDELELELEDEDEDEDVDEDENEHEDEVPEPNVMSKTCEIRITKLDHMIKEPGMECRWIPANASDLDDQAIFVGCNHVFSVPAADRPGLKKNSIYFIETYRYESLECRRNVRDAAVFDADTGGFHRFFSPDSRFNWPPPLWFMPCRLRFELLPQLQSQQIFHS